MSAGEFHRTAILHGVVLDLKTRFLYAGDLFFMNGSEFPVGDADAKLFRQLADTRGLSAERVAAGPGKTLHATLYRAYGDGFLHVD